MLALSKVEEERAQALHEKAIVIAAHQDSAICDVADRRSRGEHCVMERTQSPTFEKGGITAIIETVGGDTTHSATFPLSALSSSASNPLKRALQLIDSMTQDMKESSNKMILTTTARDIKKAKKTERIAVLLGFEGARPLEDDLSLLRTFYRLNIRCITLAWVGRNQVADSCFERTGAGLTNFGVEVVKEMNRLGMIIDVSHLPPRGFDDVLSFSRDPVIASHSNASSVFGHARNLTDEQIKALAEKQGVIGLSLWNVTREPNPTLEHLLNHADYITDLVGANHLGIGLDLNEDYPDTVYREVWKGTDFSFDSKFPKGMESMSNLRNLTRGLVGRGYSDGEILKILGRNFLRLFQRVLDGDRAS
jgi:membrane dipeptidase